MKVWYIPKSKMRASYNHNSLLNLDRKVKEKSEGCDLWGFASTLLPLSQLTLRCPKYFYSLIFRYLLILLILNNFYLFFNVVKRIYYKYKKCANLKFHFLPIAKNPKICCVKRFLGGQKWKRISVAWNIKAMGLNYSHCLLSSVHLSL